MRTLFASWHSTSLRAGRATLPKMLPTSCASGAPISTKHRLTWRTSWRGTLEASTDGTRDGRFRWVCEDGAYQLTLRLASPECRLAYRHWMVASLPRWAQRLTF